MARFALIAPLLLLAVIFASASEGLAGRAVGTDHWGQVTKRTHSDITIVKRKACRARPPTTTSSTSPSAPPPPPATSPAEAGAIFVPLSNSRFLTSTRSTSSSPPPSPTPKEQDPSPEPAPVHTNNAIVTPPAPKPTPATSEAPPPPKPKTTQAAAPSAAPASSSGSSTSSSDISQYLSAHNNIRAQHGASPLTWSDELAGKAQQWANGCVFKHSGGTLGPFGENLAAGTGSSYDIAAAVKSWTDEVSQYDPNNPVPSHFTQVVWKASTQVGCAVQSCNGIFPASFGLAKYFVCEYSPQGNVIGEFAQNVQV